MFHNPKGKCTTILKKIIITLKLGHIVIIIVILKHSLILVLILDIVFYYYRLLQDFYFSKHTITIYIYYPDSMYHITSNIMTRYIYTSSTVFTTLIH